jgi:hypothetical protein
MRCKPPAFMPDAFAYPWKHMRGSGNWTTAGGKDHESQMNLRKLEKMQ